MASNKSGEYEWLVTITKSASEKYKIPGISAAVLTSNGLEEVASYGVRKYKTNYEVTDNDCWHLGSNTKMMTASLAAICVNRGLIKWDTTVHAVFKERININPEYHEVTLLVLLSHRGGLPANVAYNKVDTKLTLAEQRFEIAKSVLSKKPSKKPQSTFLYSNVGYIIAGAMLETATNKDWETLITENIFEPLGMSSAGFGGIGTVGKVDQPWGHTKPNKPFPINGPEADNPCVIGPAGSIHCTITDWSKFITDQLKGSQGTEGLLQSDGYKYLQTPQNGDDYGLGWACLEREWANGIALVHAGSNTLFMSLVWLIPKKDLAILVCTNEGTMSERATDAIVVEILKHRKLIQ